MTKTRAAIRAIATLAAIGVMGACSGATPPSAPNAMPVTPGDSLPTAAGATAAWQRTGYAVTGTVTYAAANGVGVLTFSSTFSIGNAPGPVVYLNTTANANTGQPIRLGALKSRQGSQSYAFQIPAGVRFTHVLIWCDPFNVSMAEAVLP